MGEWSMQLSFQDGELGLWASLGGVTDRSVRVWLRDPSGQPHEASLEIDNQVRGSVRLTPAAAHDFTAAA
ncbi:MAG: hypothetical protein AB7P40_09010, partial [Chloroflexota bacterium]